MLALDSKSPLSSALPTSVKVTKGSGSSSAVGLKNPGWWGIDVKANQTYAGSFYSNGAYDGTFTALLQSDITKETLASVVFPSASKNGVWTKHDFKLVPSRDASNSNNSFIIQFTPDSNTVLNFNLISLFPPTYNNR